MRTTYLSDKILNYVYRNTAFTAITTVYAGLLTAVTDPEAGTVTETTFGSYARVSVTFGATGAALGGRQITNSGAVTFAAKGDAGSVTLVGVGIYDASTSGNLLDVVMLDGGDPIGFVSLDIATNNTVRAPGHGLTTNQKVRVESFPGLVTLPAGLSANTEYFVIAANLTADNFAVSTTQGGGAQDITAEGRGLLHRQTDLILNQGDQANFAIGTLKLADD
jgi:hypothetical protein